MDITKQKDGLGGGYKYKQVLKGTSIAPLHENVMVEEMFFGIQTTGKGLILPNDDGLDRGIKPRWAKVHAVGPKQIDVKVGDYVLIEHGRWTRGYELVDDTGAEKTIRMVDVNAILAISDTPMENSVFGSKTDAGDTNQPRAEDFGAN